MSKTLHHWSYASLTVTSLMYIHMIVYAMLVIESGTHKMECCQAGFVRMSGVQMAGSEVPKAGPSSAGQPTL